MLLGISWDGMRSREFAAAGWVASRDGIMPREFGAKRFGGRRRGYCRSRELGNIPDHGIFCKGYIAGSTSVGA